MTSALTPELDAMAGELALGVLEGDARAKALRMVLANPEFAARVAMWQQRLEPLGSAFSEVSPPAVWRAIEAELDSRERNKGVTALRLWRGSALVSGAIAASLAAVMVLTPTQQATVPPVPPRFHACCPDGDCAAVRRGRCCSGCRIRHKTTADHNPRRYIARKQACARALGT